MSILLESLKQSKNIPENDIPGLDDSHFDDELLGDEWLLKRVKFWKMVSGILFVVLIISWLIFYVNDSSMQVLADISETHSKVDDKVIQIKPSSEKNLTVSPVTEITTTNDRPVYKPKKIEKPIKTLEKIETVSEDTSVSEDIQVTQKSQQPITSTDGIIEFEALPESTLSEMPDLEIASYAVSNNVKKSFVVLNGAFYGVGETIAPHLVLVAIKQEAIIVKYKGQLISKKYSL